MKLRRISIVLLALLLAAMAMVPMVAANAITVTAHGTNGGNYIAYGGSASHGNQIAYNFQVNEYLYNPSGTLVASPSAATCASGYSCTAGDYYYYPTVHGTYRVLTIGTADGHGTASISSYVTW